MGLVNPVHADLVPSPWLTGPSSTAATWATIVIRETPQAQKTDPRLIRRSEATTVDTGLRREQVGGIIIGISVSLILLIVLLWCCIGRRHSPSWPPYPDDEPIPPPSVQPNNPRKPMPTPEKPPKVYRAPVQWDQPPNFIPQYASNEYDNSKFKSVTVKKGGIKYAEGHTGDGGPKAVGWTRKKKDFKLPPDDLNTL